MAYIFAFRRHIFALIRTLRRVFGRMDLQTLRGGVAVISGAAYGGIGFGIAQHCLSLGINVAVMDIQKAAMKESVAQLRQHASDPSLQAEGFVCDVTKPESLETCRQQIQAAFAGKHIAALFANAGVATEGFGRVLTHPIKDWRLTFEVNVIGGGSMSTVPSSHLRYLQW